VAIAISTSGNSANVLRALEVCRELRIRTIGLTGGSAGNGHHGGPPPLRVRDVSDSAYTGSHILIGHVICELVDQMLFGQRAAGGEFPPIDPMRVVTYPLTQRRARLRLVPSASRGALGSVRDF